MSYDPRAINEVIPKLNDSYFLPGIQREFVWSEDQITKLFDSILRGFPIGTFIVWEADGDLAEEQIKYKFIDDYVDEAINPGFDNRTHHNQKVPTSEDVRDTVYLVLDGQQRLTSLYVGLQGSISAYTSGSAGSKDTRSHWDQRFLYFNLFNDPDADEKTARDIHYEFEFLTPEEATGMTVTENWFRVSDVMPIVNGDTELFEVVTDIGYAIDDEFDAILDLNEAKTLKGLVQKNLNTLQNALIRTGMLNIHFDTATDREEVREEFLRINSDGTTLKRWEKLLSITMSNWAYDSNSLNARDAINGFLERYNKKYRDGGDNAHFVFDLKFVFQLLPALAGARTDDDGLGVRIRADDLTPERCAALKDVWTSDEFESSTRQVPNFLRDYNLTRRTGIKSNNLLIPLIYFVYSRRLAGTQVDLYKPPNIQRVSRFIITATLNQITSGNADTWVAGAIEAIDETNGDEFPYAEIQSKLVRKSAKSLKLDTEVLEDNLDTAEYQSGKDRLLLMLLQPDVLSDGRNFEVDHVIPQRLFNRETLGAAGVSEDRIDALQSLKHSVSNLQLLSEDEHLRKTTMKNSFPQWLQSDDFESVRERNAIPRFADHPVGDDLSGVEMFLEARREEIFVRLTNKYGVADGSIPAANH